MSEEMAILPGRGVRVDSSAPQQQEITVDNHRPHISVDELLEVIGGANGTPVLVITTSDGRLSARAVSGVQINVVPTNHEVNSSTGNSFPALRAWLLLITSLAATVTFTAGLTPPGGFWAEDKDGHFAGTPVMRDKFFRRYCLFQVSNTGAFCFSLMTIGMLVTNRDKELFSSKLFPILVASCILMLGTSFITGTWDDKTSRIATVPSFVLVFVHMSLNLVITWHRSRAIGEQPADSNNS
ncbi:hypothetical protein ACQ4PT_049892 [Festuca glaucescens]